jgi:hypothetical protein
MASAEGTTTMPDETNLPLRALLLGGTVALPAPFPAVGSLRVATDKEVNKLFGGNARLRLLIIEHALEPSTQVIRLVQLHHVRAVFEPECVDGPQLDHGKWIIPGEGWEGEFPPFGIVFVPEHEPVLTKVVFAGTAADSAEYCPPIARNGCDPDGKHRCDPDGRRKCDPDFKR